MTDGALAVPVRSHRPLVFDGGIAAAAIVAGLAIGLLPAATALALTIAVATCIATWRRAPLGLGILVLSVPLQDAVPAQIGGVELTWTRLLTVVVLGTWATSLLARRGVVRLTGPVWPFAGYVLALVASVAAARDFGAWSEEVYRWTVSLAVFVMGTSVVRRRSDAWPVLVSLALGVAGSFAVALQQVVTDSGPASFNVRGALRAYGLFGEPNPFAGFLELATLPLLAVFAALIACRRGRSLSLALWGGASGLGLAAIALSQSRGGLLGLLAGGAVLVWALWPRWGARLVIAGVACVLVLLASPLGAPVRNTFGLDELAGSGPAQVTTANFSAQERLAHWGAAWRMWREHPWLGVGAGNFPERFREATPVWRFRISRGHAHSAYLQAGAQAGTVGFVLYVALIGSVVAAIARRARRSANRRWEPLQAGAMAATCALAVHGLFEYLHVLSLGIVLSAVWAIGLVEESVDVEAAVAHGRD